MKGCPDRIFRLRESGSASESARGAKCLSHVRQLRAVHLNEHAIGTTNPGNRRRKKMNRNAAWRPSGSGIGRYRAIRNAWNIRGGNEIRNICRRMFLVRRIRF